LPPPQTFAAVPKTPSPDRIVIFHYISVSSAGFLGLPFLLRALSFFHNGLSFPPSSSTAYPSTRPSFLDADSPRGWLVDMTLSPPFNFSQLPRTSLPFLQTLLFLALESCTVWLVCRSLIPVHFFFGKAPPSTFSHHRPFVGAIIPPLPFRGRAYLRGTQYLVPDSLCAVFILFQLDLSFHKFPSFFPQSTRLHKRSQW